MDDTCKPIIVPEFEALRTCLINQGIETHDEQNEVHQKRSHLCSSEATAVRRALRKQYRLIGEGVYRATFDISDKCVMKVAKSLGGAWSNRQELEGWNNVRATRMKDVIRMFAPISHGSKLGEYLVMPKVLTHDNDPDYALIDYIEASNLLLVLLGSLGIRCADIHEDNVGRIGKRWVVLDYGMGVRCRLPGAQR